MIRVVFAVSPQKNKLSNEYAFGYKGELPWDNIRQDMLNFMKRTTSKGKKCAVVMGVSTWLSLPEKLKGRDNIVIDTRGDSFLFDEEVDKIVQWDKTVCSFEDVVKSIQKDYDDVYIIGGKSLIESAVDFADEVSLSIIHHNSVTDWDTEISPAAMHTVRRMNIAETHWYALDDVNTLTETLYKRPNV